MNLYEREEYKDEYGRTRAEYRHSRKVSFIIPCTECDGYGTRSQYGYDEVCPECGGMLDWESEMAW